MIIYNEIIPSKIENATMTEVVRDGTPMVYRICPLPGFVLHDKTGKWRDPETHIEYDAYYTGICSCGVGYDFDENPREFYTVPEDTVPDEQIFGRIHQA